MRGWADGRKGRGRGGIGGSDFYSATFRAGEATKSSHIESIPHHKAREASSQQWEQFQVIVSPIDALCCCHSLKRDITGSAKCSPEKQTRSHWTVEMLYIDSY